MLSLCMIVRNEEKHIRRCLESVQGLVDEIIIVDTGSIDNTVSIAESLGAQVYSHQWENDFSKARNESLRYAHGDWILVLDADEVIAKRDHDRINALLNDKSIMGYRMILRNYQDKGGIANWCSVEDECPEALGISGYIPAYLVRLFRRGEGIIFHGALHEVVEYSIQDKNGRIVLTDIPIHHYGRMLEQERMDHKNKLYREVGEKKVALNQKDARAHWDLGTQYIEMGLFKEAVEVLTKAVELEPGSVLALFNLGVAYANLGIIDKARSCYIEAIRLEPGHVGASNNLAGLFNEAGALEDAKKLYEDAIKENPEHFIVLYNYGLLLEKLSDFSTALECYEKVVSINPDFSGAYSRLGHISVKLGDKASADTLFKKASELESKNDTTLPHTISQQWKEGFKMTGGKGESQAMEGGLFSNPPRLSLCMIVKNEEEYLPRCLSSLKGFVDEIIIVDTGSTDRTIGIAKGYGAKVINHVWEDDFSKARNVYLDNATGDWILMLDADEVIAESDLKKIREIIKDPSAKAYRLIQRTYEHNGGFAGWKYNTGDYEEGKGYPGYGESPLTRLYRRHQGLRYKGKVHEVIEPSLEELDIYVINADIPIHHYGQVRECRNVGRKLELYRELGEKQLEDNPGDVKNMCDLGINYIVSGELERAEELLKRTLEIDPSRKRAHYNLGVVYAKQKKYFDALKYFTNTLELDKKDASARYNCGLMLEAIGFPQEAFDQYREAISTNPEHVEAIFRLASLLKSNGYNEDAISFYHRVMEIDPLHKGAREAVSGSHRGSVVFLNHGLEFDGNTLTEKPLGGTETALINMARELGNLGWEVKVFNNCSRPGNYNGIEYINFSKFDDFIKGNDIDIFISVRYLDPFLKFIPARLKILWSEDAPDQPFLKMLAEKEIIDRIDSIFTVSNWQAEGFISDFNIPEDKIFITTNGINPDYFASSAHNRHPHRIIYSSTPFRGLDHLLKLFPKIKESIPDAELLVFSGMSVYQMPKEQEDKRFGKIYKLADQPGVLLKGNVSQHELAEAMLSSSIMAYPNCFQETSCISVIEAMAAGLPVVTSNSGALPETLEGVGIFIGGNPGTGNYQDSFVKEVIAILSDHERWRLISEKSRKRAFEIYTWANVANKWDEKFSSILKPTSRKEQVAVSRS